MERNDEENSLHSFIRIGLEKLSRSLVAPAPEGETLLRKVSDSILRTN